MTCGKPTSELPATEKARVFLVDDHPIVRRGFQVLCSLEPDLAVCGEAEGTAEAWSKIPASSPDVVVVDLSLKEGNGLELIGRLRKAFPDLKILVFSMHHEAAYVTQALRAGADDFVPKEHGAEKVIGAIRALLRAGSNGSKVQAEPRAEESPSASAGPSAPLTHRLSSRELEVLHLLGQGLASRQIAERLHVSARTIDSHREHIKRKLGFKNAPALVHYALRFAHFGDAA